MELENQVVEYEIGTVIKLNKAYLKIAFEDLYEEDESVESFVKLVVISQELNNSCDGCFFNNTGWDCEKLRKYIGQCDDTCRFDKSCIKFVEIPVKSLELQTKSDNNCGNSKKSLSREAKEVLLNSLEEVMKSSEVINYIIEHESSSCKNLGEKISNTYKKMLEDL